MDQFPVLRGISFMLKVLALFVVLVGSLGGIALGSQLGNPGGVTMFAVWLVAGGYAIGLWASAEVIGVLLAIEENTRQNSSTIYRATSSSSVNDRPSRDVQRPAWMA